MTITSIMNITLTITQIGNRALASVPQIFETEEIRNIVAQGTGVMFQYPIGVGSEERYENFIATESFSTIEGLMNSIPASGVKAIWGRLDATGGKAIGTHDLVDPATGKAIEIPINAMITDGLAHVLTTFTSATDAATIALGVPTDGAAGLKAAIAISNGANPWDAGKTALIPVGSAATAFGPLTAKRKVQAVVAVEALTAGRMDVLIQYITKPV